MPAKKQTKPKTKPEANAPASAFTIPAQKAQAFIDDLQRMMYQDDDGSWDSEKGVNGCDLVELVCSWMSHLGLQPSKRK